jgi:hypothetical protein
MKKAISSQDGQFVCFARGRITGHRTRTFGGVPSRIGSIPHDVIQHRKPTAVQQFPWRYDEHKPINRSPIQVLTVPMLLHFCTQIEETGVSTSLGRWNLVCIV